MASASMMPAAAMSKISLQRSDSIVAIGAPACTSGSCWLLGGGTARVGGPRQLTTLAPLDVS